LSDEQFDQIRRFYIRDNDDYGQIAHPVNMGNVNKLLQYYIAHPGGAAMPKNLVDKMEKECKPRHVLLEYNFGSCTKTLKEYIEMDYYMHHSRLSKKTKTPFHSWLDDLSDEEFPELFYSDNSDLPF